MCSDGCHCCLWCCGSLAVSCVVESVVACGVVDSVVLSGGVVEYEVVCVVVDSVVVCGIVDAIFLSGGVVESVVVCVVCILSLFLMVLWNQYLFVLLWLLSLFLMVLWNQ